VTPKPTSVPELFAKYVISAVGREHPAAEARAISQAIGENLTQRRARVDEALNYYPLCERAWLYWSRDALDFITVRALRQATLGILSPPQIRNARDAAEAHSRCAVHLRLLDIAARRLEHMEEPWQLEAARHVTSATQKTLAVAAKIRPLKTMSALELGDGVASAADALTAAIRGGLVSDPAGEVGATLRGMRRC